MLTTTFPLGGIFSPATQPGACGEVSNNLEGSSRIFQELQSSSSVRDQLTQTEKREIVEQKVGERERERSRRRHKQLGLSKSERSKRSPTSLKRHTPLVRANRSRGDSHTKGNHTAPDRLIRPALSSSRQARSSVSGSHDNTSRRRRPPSLLQGRVRKKITISPPSKYSSSSVNGSHRRSHSNFDKENRRYSKDPRPCLRRHTRKRKRTPSPPSGQHGQDLRVRVQERAKYARRDSPPPPRRIREIDRSSSNLHDFRSCPPTPTRGELTADDISDLSEPVDNVSEALWSAGSDYLSCPPTPTGYDSIEVESISEAELRASSDEDGECDIESISETRKCSQEGNSDIDLVSDSEEEENWLSVSDGDWSGKNGLFECIYNEEREVIFTTENVTMTAEVYQDKENDVESRDLYGVPLTATGPYTESGVQEQIVETITSNGVDNFNKTEAFYTRVEKSEGAKIKESCLEEDKGSKFTNPIISDGELSDSDVDELSKEEISPRYESEDKPLTEAHSQYDEVVRDDGSINLDGSQEAGSQLVKLVNGLTIQLEDAERDKAVTDDLQHSSDNEDLEEGEISDSESEPDSPKEDFDSIQEAIRGCSEVETIKLSELKTCTSTSCNRQARDHSSEASHLSKRWQYQSRPLEQSHRLNRNSPRPSSRHEHELNMHHEHSRTSKYSSRERIRKCTTHTQSKSRLEQRPSRQRSRHSREEHGRHFSSSQSKRTNSRR